MRSRGIPATEQKAYQSVLPPMWRATDGDEDLERIGARIRRTMDGYLAAIAARYPEAPTFVCLSGGLDSTGIAALARRHFSNVTAVSFDLVRADGRSSEDRRAAERLSRDLDLPLLTVTATHQELFEHLDTVLVDGIDWRDFNVHAGLVNAMLASRIDLAAPPAPGAGPRLVLTGDFANEFLSDYHAEHYKGVTYYRLPRLSGRSLRNSLVRGLATSHREVGVFAAWGLTTIQPYAVAVDDYLSLPDALFDEPDRKQQLCQAIFGDLVPDYIYARKKSRAQVGDAAGGGVLHAAVDRGIDNAALRRRFAELHDVTVERQLDAFLRAGHYRTAIPFLNKEA
jgi:asparagine synthetase B (glutamine-hydrolysing)